MRIRPFQNYEIKCDKQDVISALQVSFEEEIILTQYCVENKRLDAYLPKYNRGIEVDECNDESKDPNYEKRRQLILEGITVIRTNPEAPNCINRLINQIYMHIIKSTKKQTKKSTKKSLIVDLPKALLELNKIKVFKTDCPKILPNYKNE